MGYVRYSSIKNGQGQELIRSFSCGIALKMNSVKNCTYILKMDSVKHFLGLSPVELHVLKKDSVKHFLGLSPVELI